jgi:hypothetical protein
MNISFLTSNPSEKSGSYRIWVKDLSKTLLELGHDTKVYTNHRNINKNIDCIILCKSAYKLADLVKNSFPNCIIGAINIDKDYVNSNIDFVIVGSIEEYTSMGRYRNVFIYPLIERKFINIPQVIHNNEKEFFKICFHGHYPHLFKFEPFLKNAIELFDKNVKKVKLEIITGNPKFKWEIGRPNVVITMHDYDENFIEIVQSCDIGIVPNVSDIRVVAPTIKDVTAIEYGLYNTDYFLRMKNKTNAGRAYVFYQLGIPVIHDLSPSSFELMTKSGYNICAHDDASYLKEIKRLFNPIFRNKVANKNKAVMEDYYNPKDHAEKLIKNIEEINKNE